MVKGTSCTEVFVLQERTLIGRPDASTEQDIQLLGLGIMSEHCIVTLEGSDVYLTPLEGARSVLCHKDGRGSLKVTHNPLTISAVSCKVLHFMKYCFDMLNN